jgi:hypothetical protein
MGVQEIGAVFASRRDQELYRDDAVRIAASLKLRVRSYSGADLAKLGQTLDQATPAVLLFIGGTPELVQFTQGLDRQARQRWVVALADVNLQTVLQMGGARATPVIATQVVPMVHASSVPVVRRYREALSRLFDEPPVALSLAGFIAARYTYEVMAEIDGPLQRASVLAAFRRRSAADVGGYQIRFDAEGRSATFVTQTMLTADGRLVG